MIDPYDNPARNAAVMANLVANFRLIHVIPMLQEMTLDQMVDWWRYAQRLKAQQTQKERPPS